MGASVPMFFRWDYHYSSSAVKYVGSVTPVPVLKDAAALFGSFLGMFTISFAHEDILNIYLAFNACICIADHDDTVK